MNAEAIIRSDDGVDIDITKLSPGDYIEPTSIEAVFEVQRTDPRYGLKALSLAKLIERKSSADGRPLQCKGEGYGIRIMTAEEQVEYNWEAFIASLRRIDRAEEWMGKIEASGLSSDVARLKVDRQQKMASIRQALEAPRKKLRLSFADEPAQLGDGQDEERVA